MLSLFQTLLGHQSSVRSLCFSPCSSILCSGCLSGEVRLWSVAAAACVGSYHAHRGSTQSLNFLQGGNLLLSAGHDSVVRTMVLHSSFSVVRLFCTLTGILKHSVLRSFLLSRLMCGPVVLGDLSLYWERKRYFHVLKLELLLISS